MTPLLLLAILATPTTPPATINPPDQRSQTMAQGNSNLHAGGGNPPQYHPPGHGINSTAAGRVGRDARNPSLLIPHSIASQGPTVTPIEHTARPTRL